MTPVRRSRPRVDAVFARPSIGFLFVGGEHQQLHIAPLAARLDQDGETDVRAFVATEPQEQALRRLMKRLGSELAIEQMPLPGWARMIGSLDPKGRSEKITRLVAARSRLAGLDAVVVAERTSTILKRLPGPLPYLVHVPHGAGDRAKGFERRIREFDHVIVAGHKDRNRMIAEGVVAPLACSVSGYVKVAAVRRLVEARSPRRLFRNDRPVVLYNPHFVPGLSSWPKFAAELISAFRRQDDFNLIVAPHARLLALSSASERRRLAGLAVEDRIIIDPGSTSSCDMSYTLAADIYVGDVSSQVYEFLTTPKPCVFLNPGIACWQDDPNYAFWHFGEVIPDPAELLAGIRRAPFMHATYRSIQVEAVRSAFGTGEGDAVGNAAAIVASLARARRDWRIDHG